MIEPYYGEFLINPVPLELSFNYCSHKCAYCFANLNQPGRKVDAAALMRFLQDYKNRKTLQAQLLQQGYPVVISNKVDPFAASNYRVFLPVLEVLTALGIPVQIQTKGGQGIDQALGLLSPSVWYISISFADDSLRKKIEPGAPSLDSRLALIEKLVGLGHRVVVGINPLVPDWLPDPAPLLASLKARGVWGVWVEILHLNPDQIRNMTDRERAALTEPIMKRARKRKPHPVDREHFKHTRTLAAELGLEVYSVGQPTPSNFFDPYRELYQKTFPTMQDFINLCYDAELGLDDLISFDQFAGFMAQSLPKGEYRISHYLGATARTLWKKYHIPNQLTYTQLLSIIWDQPETKYSMARLPNFAYAGMQDDDGTWTQLVDENYELPYIVFSENFNGYYHDIRGGE